MESAPALKNISFLGDHLPRQCGIATFTSDICGAVATAFPRCHCIVGAVNDRSEGYDYPDRVRFEIDQTDLVPIGARRIFSTRTRSRSFRSSMNLGFTADLPVAICWNFCAMSVCRL